MPMKNLRQQNQIVISQPLHCHVYRRHIGAFSSMAQVQNHIALGGERRTSAVMDF